MICKKYILIIIILAVVFLPQCFVYASDTEITDKIEQQMLEKIDMSEIEKYSKDYLPDRLSFSDIVDAILAGDQKAGEKICEYIYELFFYEIAAVKPVIINVLCYTILFMVFSRLIFWRQDYVYNVSFLFMYASVISMLMASFFVLSDVAKGCIDVLLTYLTALSLMYRLLSAALQPVSDNRIVEGIEAVARAGNLYYIVIRDASILFFIVIAIVCASTSFMGG